MSEVETLRAQLRASFKNRAMVYLEVYRVLEEEFGRARAAELLKRAIYRRGCAVGEHFKAHGPTDLAGLEKAFVGFLPDGGRMFAPEVVRNDGRELEIQFHACPLQDAWREAGLPEADVAHLCEIAGVVDNGTFEAAGFEFRSETWRPGREGCCHLFISKGA